MQEQHLHHLRKVTEEFKAELERCSADPAEECVHHVRTGTRRVQAMLETVLRETAKPSPDLQHATKAWLKDLKKIRRAAGTVRDLDVHRGLLKDLVERKQQPNGHPETSDLITAPTQALPLSPLEQQADTLDTWLKDNRHEEAARFQKQISKRTRKVIDRESAFEAAAHAMPADTARRQPKPTAVVALEAFARLSHEMPQLDETNLHDFRKGAKNARYIAESGASDATATAVAKALKRLQDDIGDWHDWLVLSEEARTAVPDAEELIEILNNKTAHLYTAALKTSARLRGRLMGELQALQPAPRRKPVRRAASAAKPAQTRRRAS